MSESSWNPRVPRRSLLIFGALAALPIRRARAGDRVVYLQPLGAVQSVELGAVGETIGSFYGVTVRPLPSIAPPRSAFYAPRRRYRAERLLATLAERIRQNGVPNQDTIIGLTHSDISTTKGNVPDWGILGLADLDGPACVISTFRCARKARNADHALERLRKVAVHELGHAFGLVHCTQSEHCLMRDAGGSALSIDSEDDVCSHCRGRLAARGITAGPSPWRDRIAR